MYVSGESAEITFYLGQTKKTVMKKQNQTNMSQAQIDYHIIPDKQQVTISKSALHSLHCAPAFDAQVL